MMIAVRDTTNTIFNILRNAGYNIDISIGFTLSLLFYNKITTSKEAKKLFNIPTNSTLEDFGKLYNNEIRTTFLGKLRIIENNNEAFAGIFSFLYKILKNKDSDRIIKGLINSTQIKNWEKVDFEQYIELHYQNKSNRHLQLYTTPSIIKKLIINLINPKNKQTIFDPAVGIGGFFTAIQNEYPFKRIQFTGQELNENTYNLCRMNMIMNDIYEANIIQGNSLYEKLTDNFGNFDIAVSNPPWGRMQKNDNNLFFTEDRYADLSVTFLLLMLASIHNKGKIITVMPESFLFSNLYTSIRERLIEEDFIEAIISLPIGIFPSVGIKTSILIINKNKPYSISNKVILIKAFEDIWRWKTNKASDFPIQKIVKNYYLKKSETGFSIVISKDELADKDNIWNIERFLHSDIEELKERRETEDVVKLNKVIKTNSVILGKHFLRNKISDEIDNNISMLVVKFKNLSKSITDYHLDVGNLDKVFFTKNQLNKLTLIDYSVLLINLRGSVLCPTFFKYNGIPILLSSGMIAIDMEKNKSLDLEYFIYHLQSKFVQVQIDIINRSSAILNINKKSFFNIEIILPPLVEQKKYVEDIKNVLVHEEEKRLDALKQKLNVKANAVEYDVIATITHNLSQKIGMLIGDMETLQYYLEQKKESGEPISSNDPIAPLFEGESITDVDSLEKVENRLKNNILDAGNILAKTREILQKNTIHPQETNIYQFLKKIKSQYIDDKFSISIYKSSHSIIVDIDQEAMKSVFQNLIDNAVKHGFGESRKHEIVFELDKTEVPNRAEEMLRILYKNDGWAFPKNFNFNEYKKLGGRAGNNKGQGLGGYWINKIIDLHRGEFNYIPVEKNSTPYQVQFEILLPIKYKK